MLLEDADVVETFDVADEVDHQCFVALGCQVEDCFACESLDVVDQYVVC